MIPQRRPSNALALAPELAYGGHLLARGYNPIDVSWTRSSLVATTRKQIYHARLEFLSFMTLGRKYGGGAESHRQFQIALMPPSTGRSTPAMKLASSEARNKAVDAISSGRPSRPNGTAAAN
jgi:hypothetical protein